MDEKMIVVYNRSKKRFKVSHDKTGGTYLEPGTSLELLSARAGKLIKMYSKELVDMSKMAKPKSVSDIKGIKERDEKISALMAKIAELEASLKEALTPDTSEDKEKVDKIKAALEAAEKDADKNKDKKKEAALKAKIVGLKQELKEAKEAKDKKEK